MTNCSVNIGDGLDFARSLEANTVDVVLTDPPYCSGATREAQKSTVRGQGLRRDVIDRDGWFDGDNMTTPGLTFLLRSLAFEASRFLRPAGSMLVFMDWRMVPALVPAIESSGLRWQNLIVWAKPMGLGNGFRASYELAAHFTNGAPEFHDRGTGNLISAGRSSPRDRLHYTEKPVDLLVKILRVVCPAGGLVFDPFAGSGSSGIAALSMGASAVLVERDPRFVEVIRQRIDRFQAIGGLLHQKSSTDSTPQDQVGESA